MLSDTVTNVNIPMAPPTTTGVFSLVNDLKKLVIARNVGIATTGGMGVE